MSPHRKWSVQWLPFTDAASDSNHENGFPNLELTNKESTQWRPALTNSQILHERPWDARPYLVANKVVLIRFTKSCLKIFARKPLRSKLVCKIGAKSPNLSCVFCATGLRNANQSELWIKICLLISTKPQAQCKASPSDQNLHSPWKSPAGSWSVIV